MTALLSLLGVFKTALGWIPAAFRWLMADWCRPVIAALLLALVWQHFVSMPAAYADGRADLLAEQETERQLEQGRQQVREAQAAARRTSELADGDARDRAATQTISEATKGLPDAPLSARQRARACAELRAQARARNRPEPAC